MVGSHRQFSPQDFLVLVRADCCDGYVPPSLGDDLQCLFDRVVVGFVDRIHEVIAFNIVPRTVELNLVLRGVGHSSCAN